MANATVGELQIALSFDDKTFDSSLNKVGNKGEQTAGKLSSAFATAGKAIIANIAIGAFGAAANAVTNFGSSVVSTGMEFDTAMSQVAATMGVSVDAIERLSVVAQNMGATTKFTATEAAEGLNILAMAGLNAQEQIAGIPVVLDLASAGAMSLESSASYIVGAVNGFSDSMDNAQYYADLMAKGATLANTSVSGLGAALGRSAATAASYGQAADSVTLSLLRLAAQNVTGEEAATALNRAMADLYTPTESAASALDHLGISVYTSSGEARDFNDVADELALALSKMSDEEANAYASTIFTTQGLRAFRMMTVATTEQVDAFRDGLANAFGSASAQALTQIDNLEGSMTILSSSLDGVKLQIYNGLKPALLDGANGLLAFASVIGNSLAGADPSAAISTFIDKFGKAIFNGLSQLGTVIGKVAPVLVRAIVGLVPDLVQGAIAAISNLAEEIATQLPGLLVSIQDAIFDLVDVLTDPGNIEMFINAGLTLFMSIVEAIPLVVTNLVERLPLIIQSIIEGLLSAIPQLIEAAITLLNAIVEAIPQIIPPLLAAIPQLIQTLIGYLLDPEVFTMLFDAAIQLLVALVMAIPEIITQLIPVLPEILTTIIGFLLDPNTMTQLLNAAVQLFLQLVLAVPKILGQLVKAFGTLVGTLWENIKTMFGKFAENFGTFITDIFKGAINGMIAFIENFLNTPIGLINGFIDIINDAFGWLGVHIGSIPLVSLPRLQYGGVIPGDDYSGDHVLARVNSGEMVLTRGQQGALWNAIESGQFGGAPAMPEPAIADVDVWARAIAQAFVDEEDEGEVEPQPMNVTMYNEINSELDADEIGNLMLESIRRATA